MEEEFKGALYQDNNFIFLAFDGLKIERLVICEDPETEGVILVYLKVENKKWHQFFLDSGYGFLHNYEEIDPDDEAKYDDDYVYIDRTAELELLGKTISKIWCEPIENFCQIIIELNNNDKLVLRPLNPKDFESDCELIQLDKVWAVYDYCGKIIYVGIANYKNKTVYFEKQFVKGFGDLSNDYLLTPLTPKLFTTVQETWNYWLEWQKQPKIDHPHDYAEKRKTQSYESLLDVYDKEDLQQAEKCYKNQMLLNEFIKNYSQKIIAKASFEGNLDGTNTYVKWKNLKKLIKD